MKRTTSAAVPLPLHGDPSKRLNVGCGRWPLHYWTNLDADPTLPADIHAKVPPLPYPDGGLDEIYAGHVLEHMTHTDGRAFLVECYRVLTPGGRLGVLVPDTREVLRRWLKGEETLIEYPVGTYHDVSDLDAVCRLFLYSTVQDSPHLWSYDQGTLGRAIEGAGFRLVAPINRHRDPRIPVGAWYQCGWDAVKP